MTFIIFFSQLVKGTTDLSYMAKTDRGCSLTTSWEWRYPEKQTTALKGKVGGTSCSPAPATPCSWPNEVCDMGGGGVSQGQHL